MASGFFIQNIVDFPTRNINAIHLLSVVIEKLRNGALKVECPYHQWSEKTFSCFHAQNGKWV